MPSSVCKLHLSHIRRAVVYPPCEFRAVLTDRPRHYKSGASLDRRRGPPRLLFVCFRPIPRRSAFCSRLFVRIFPRPFAVVRRLFCFLFGWSNLFFSDRPPRPSSRLESAYFLFLAVFSATSEIRYEHPRGHPRKCVRPRPRNFRAAFPEKFPKKFSRFVFAFRFRVSFFQRVGIYAMNTRTAPNVHASHVSC